MMQHWHVDGKMQQTRKEYVTFNSLANINILGAWNDLELDGAFNTGRQERWGMLNCMCQRLLVSHLFPILLLLRAKS
jgi:hypothetical protein